MEVSYYLVAIVCNVVNTYNLYRFYNYAFDKNKYNSKVECISYIVYWIVNTFIYLFVNLPMVTLLTNFSAFYLLTFNYKGRQKQKIFSALFFNIALILIECIVVFVTTTTPLKVLGENSYSHISGPIFTAIFGYLFVEILIRRKNIRNQIKLPIAYWIVLLLTPICSCIISIYIQYLNNVDAIGVTICCLLFLVINLSIFYLYDKIIAYISSQKENETLAQENLNYRRLQENMQVSVDTTRQLRHDLKNHFIAMEGMLKARKYDELKAYLDKHSGELKELHIDTGNISIDSILNFKWEECKNNDIELVTEIAIPEGLEIAHETLTAVLGNLLDNAIEATKQVEEDRKISLTLCFEKGYMFLDIINPYRGTLREENGEYLTIKADKENHGYGLKSVKRAVKQNGGLIKVHTENQRFHVHVMLSTS